MIGIYKGNVAIFDPQTRQPIVIFKPNPWKSRAKCWSHALKVARDVEKELRQ